MLIGHGKAEALRAAAPADDPGVDAHQPPFGIDQRPAGVARVDGRVGLNEVLVAVDAEATAPQRADDAHRDGLADAERIADGQDHVAHLQLVAVCQRDRRQVLPLHLQHRGVCGRVGADDLGVEFLVARRQRHLDLVRAIDDMVGGEDVAVRRDDHARAEALLPARARLAPASRILAKEPPEERVVEERVGPLANGHGGVDVHHAGRDLLDHRRNAGRRLEFAVDRGFLDGQLRSWR